MSTYTLHCFLRLDCDRLILRLPHKSGLHLWPPAPHHSRWRYADGAYTAAVLEAACVEKLRALYYSARLGDFFDDGELPVVVELEAHSGRVLSAHVYDLWRDVEDGRQSLRR